MHALRLALLGAPGAVVLGLFFLLPLAVVGVEAFAEGGAGFVRLAADPVFWRGLAGTVALGLSAGALSLAVGLAVAWHLAHIGPAARAAILFLIALPLTFSGLIVAYGFILAFGRAGFVTMSLAAAGLVDPAAFSGFIYGPVGLAFAYCYYLIPRVVMLMLPVFQNFDRAQILAAESMGAGRLRALADVLAPQVMPTAVAAFCLVAAVAMGTYGTALALVGTQVNILPLLLYSKVADAGADFPLAAALSLVLLALCTAVMGLGEWVAARREGSHGAHA